MPPEGNLEQVAGATESEKVESLHDAISSAFDASEAPETPAAPETTEAPASETGGAKQEAQQGLERDESGKFKPKEPEKPAEVKPATEQGAEQPAVEKGAEQPKAVRAPGSWRPALREKFAKLDADVQHEILKREREIAVGFNEVSEVKKFRDTFLTSVNQFSGVINAEGGRPLETIHNLLKTANILYVGTPMQKAQTVAAIVKTFGIDIATLDEELSAAMQGRAGGARTPQPDVSELVQQQVQQALAPLLQQRERANEELAASAGEELNAFMEDPKNEFAYDVKDTMADLLEMAAKRGQKMDLQTAYSRAILAHSDIADIVARRKVSQQAESASAAAAAAKKKAVSISGAPATISAPVGNSLGDAIRAAIDQHSS